MKAALFVGQSAANMRLTPCKTEMRWKPDSIPGSRKSNRLEGLNLFRWLTHTLRCRGAFLEDAQLDADQIDQNALAVQMIASKEEQA